MARSPSGYNDYYGAAAGEPAQRPPPRTPLIRKLLPYILVATLAFGGMIGVGIARPDIVNDLLVRFDQFGLTEVGRIEQSRVARIMNLPIAYEKRQVLVDHTVFIGATADMVLLSLGEPKAKARQQDPGSKAELDLWYYYLPGDTRPTALYFSESVLVGARQVSVLESTEATPEAPAPAPATASTLPQKLPPRKK